MTAPMMPSVSTQIADPTTEARVRQNTEAIMKAMRVDRARAQAMALEYEGLSPTQTPRPDRRMEAGKDPRGVGELYLDALTGMLSTAARGITLGATDNIPALKESAAQYRQDNKYVATAVEMGAGMALNPLGKGLALAAKGTKAVPVVGKVMAALDRAANPTAARTAWEAFKSGAKAGGLYGGAYGFNTQTEGGLGNRVASGAANAVIAMPVGGILGTTIHKISGKAPNIEATMRGRAAPPDPEHTNWQPTDEAMGLIEKAFLLDRGKLPDATDLQPGFTLADLLGPNGRQLFQEAGRSSPRALTMMDRFRNARMGSSTDEIMGAVQEATGFSGMGAGKFNPEALSRHLRARASADAAPLYREINAANPVIPKSPMLEAVLESPSIRATLQSKELQLFAENRAAADKVRELMAQAGRGAVMGADEVQSALGAGAGASDPIALLTAKMGRPLTPEELARFTLPKSKAPVTKDFDWRTLNTLKFRLDKHLEGQPSDQLKNTANEDIKTLRAGLLRAMDAAVPGFAKARKAYADPTLASEMLKRGEAAARKSADMVEADLLDPDLTVLGDAAIEHYKLGVLGVLQKLAGKRPLTESPEGFWTQETRRLVKAIARPEKATQVDGWADIMRLRHETATFAPTRASEGIATGTERLRGAVGASLAAMAAQAPWVAVRQAATEVGRRGRKMPDPKAEELTAMLISREPYRVLEWLHARRMGFDAGKLAGQIAGRGTGIELSAPPQP